MGPVGLLNRVLVAIAVALMSLTPAVEHFDGETARTHAVAIARPGPRVEGTAEEMRGFEYARDRLASYGYETTWQDVPLLSGGMSHNLVAVKRGLSSRRFVLGAHVDTKPPTPGGNDNASGVGALLELARLFAKDDSIVPTVVFVVFGAEESVDGNPSHHHFGSRAYVRSLSGSERLAVAGMLSIDMVGYGSTMCIRTMRRGPQSLSDAVRRHGSSIGTPLRFELDRGRTGWSDHEPFELAGIPAAWIEWREDPAYHKAGDDAGHIRTRPMQMTGTLVETYLRSLAEKDLRALRGRPSRRR